MNAEFSAKSYIDNICRDGMKRIAIVVVLLAPAALTACSQNNPLDKLVVHSNVAFKVNEAQTCSLTTGKPVFEGGPKNGIIEMFCSERADYDPLGGDNWEAVLQNPYLAYPHTRITKVVLSKEAQRLFQSERWKVNLFCQKDGNSLACVLSN